MVVMVVVVVVVDFIFVVVMVVVAIIDVSCCCCCCFCEFKLPHTTSGLSTFLMTQPCGFHCREVANEKRGFYTLPEYPYALEPRTLTRLDAYDYARRAFDAGVRYVGGCCGFEPHHVRALAMELEVVVERALERDNDDDHGCERERER